MPELGKAVYALVIDSAQFEAGLADAEVTANQAMGRIGKAFKGEEAAAESAATGTTAAAGKIAAASEAAGAGAAAGAARTESAWARSSAAIARTGKTSSAWAGMIGIGAAYFAVKGGLEWLRDANQGWREVGNAIKVTGMVAGLSMPHLKGLSDWATKTTGYSEGLNAQIEQMMMRFTNIRNVGPGTAAVFDRVFKHVYNVSIATGKEVNAVTLALGKAFQDPAKYLGILGRSGVTFNKVQTAMIKKIEAGKAAFKGYTGVYGAQLFMLEQLDHRYGGLAKTVEGSFNVQMRKAKDNIYKASASILQGLMPSMVKLAHITVAVAGAMRRHRTAVKVLLLAYIGLKVAMLVTSQVMKAGMFVVKALRIAYLLLTGSLTRAKFAEIAFGRAAAGSAVKTEAATVAAGGFRLGLLALLNPFTMVIAAAGLAAAAVWKLKEAWDAASAAMDNADRIEAALGKKESKGLYINARYKHIRREHPKMSAADAMAQAHADADKKFGKHYGDNEGIHKGGKGGGKGGAKPPGVIHDPKKGGGTTKDILGPGWTRLDIAYQKAQRTKGEGDDRRVLEQERTYLEGILAHKHLTLQQRDEIEGQLTGVVSQLQGLGGSGRSGGGSGKSLWSPRMRIALARAQRTKTLKDDIGVYEKQRRALVLEEKHTKNMKDRAAIEEEITKIDKTLAKLRKQEAADLEKKHTVTLQEVQDMLNLRSTFFGQFAPDIFHTGDDGKLHMGGKGSVDVQQHNHYHEIPKDRHHEARRMKRAVEGRMA